MKKINRITNIALLTTVMIVQETLLTFIPSVQFTFLLFVIISRNLKFIDVITIIILHSTLDFLIFGGNIITLISMFIGYLIIPISLKLYRNNNFIVISLLSIIWTYWYSFSFLIANVVIFKYDPLLYFISDQLFTFPLAIFNFIIILWFGELLDEKIKILQNN